MSLGEKLARLRREHNLTQEQLAELLGVSRQAISKWESNAAYPETEKLIRLARMYDCSLDYLVLDKSPEKSPETVFRWSPTYFERVSKIHIGTLPLWHINLGYGRVAKGVFAIGLVSKGIVSVGLCSVGVFSLGLVTVGLLAIGMLAVGLLAVGSIAVGILSLGALAVGTFSIGAMSMGKFAVGAAAIGKYAALGDSASAAVAVGFTKASGETFSYVGTNLSSDVLTQATAELENIVPRYLSKFKDLFLWFLHHQI